VKVKTLIAGEGQAALEAEFIGTHTGDFPRHGRHR
jgi:hypothetical protein